jgi:hypothetical protein
MNRLILNYIEHLLIDDDYQKNNSAIKYFISIDQRKFSRHNKKVIFFSISTKKEIFSLYIGYICLLDDVDVCLSLYTINHSINRERKKRGRDECDIPYRHTTNIYVCI